MFPTIRHHFRKLVPGIRGVLILMLPAASLADEPAVATDQASSPPTSVVNLTLIPESATVKEGQPVIFFLGALFADERFEIVTDRATFAGAPGAVFTAGEPGIYSVVARFQQLSVSAAGTVEAERPGGQDLDDAIETLIAAAEPAAGCDPERLLDARSHLADLFSQGQTAANRFFTYTSKCDQLIADRAADPCWNGLLAYCYESGRASATRLAHLTLTAQAAATELLAWRAGCRAVSERSDTINHPTVRDLIARLADLRHRQVTAQTVLANLEFRLWESGCDKTELANLAVRYLPANLDPDFLESGGIMRELAGDGFDNDGDGLVDTDADPAIFPTTR
ncbi:MAG: hypothetical protein ABIF77_04155 [bacterium]